MSAFVVGVAGGTGSGKTTVARKLVEEFADQPVRLIPQDAYYKDLAGVAFEERVQVNYDHPLAFDNDLLAQHLDDLLAGKAVEQPIYNYHTHSRSEDTIRVEPATIILVEGILVLEDEKLRDRMNIKIYVDTDADERFIRRLKRDLIERLPSPTDRRTHALQLTREGQKTLKRAKALAARHEARLAEKLGADAHRELLRVLGTFNSKS